MTDKTDKNFNSTGDFYKDIAISVDAAISVVEVVDEKDIFYRYFNDAFKELFSYDTDGVLNKRPQELKEADPDLISVILKDFHDCIEQKVLLLRERRISWLGEERCIMRHLSPVLNDEKKVIYIVNHIMDTTPLRSAQTDLKEHKVQIEQKNIALQEVIKQIDLEKKKIKDNIVAHVDYVLMPIVEKIQLKGQSKKYVALLKQSLEDTANSFGKRISDKHINLTTREIEICNMVKNGMTNKEIASLINISTATVERHRANIRTKFNLVHGNTNLTSFLRTI